MSTLRAARPCGGVLLLVVLAGVLSVTSASKAQEQKMRPELALVAPEAFGFVHLRPADLWQSDLGAALRQQYPIHAAGLQIEFSKVLGANLSDVESISLVFPTVTAVDYFSSRRKGVKNKAIAEPRGEPEAPIKQKVESEKKECGDKDEKGEPQDGLPGDVGTAMILTTSKPYDRAKVLHQIFADGSLEEKHAGKTIHFSKQPFDRRFLHFLNDRTYLTASSLALLRQVLARPAQAKAQGAVALAMKNHPFVLGLNMMEASGQILKKELTTEWTRPWQREGLWSMVPLLEMRSATLVGAVAKDNKIKLQAQMHFADAKRASEAVEAAQDTLALLRLLGLGQVRQEMRSQMEDAEDPRDSLFAVLLIKQAESALRKATVEQLQTTVHVQAEGSFDVNALRKHANAEADTLLKDENYRRSRQRRLSMNNLKNIGLALHSWHDVYRGLPPAAICSKKDGKPLLSWRVAILPFIDQTPLYNEFKLDEAWDSPHNIKLLPIMPKLYAPIGLKTKEPHTTFYQAFVGTGAAFETHPDKNSMFGAKSNITLIGFFDGTSNTIGVAEAMQPVPWTKPADLTYDAGKPLPKLGGLFKEGFHVLFMDATVRYLSNRIDEKTLRALITRSGGEAVDWSKYELP